ncbi:MAG: hypothetical protein IKR13_01145 [Victivallales bacterium]|nr:hypothetical protein [Victivallales bacterium]
MCYLLVRGWGCGARLGPRPRGILVWVYFDLLAALAIAAMAVPAAASPAQVMVMIILISSYAMGWLLMLRPPGRRGTGGLLPMLAFDVDAVAVNDDDVHVLPPGSGLGLRGWVMSAGLTLVLIDLLDNGCACQNNKGPGD